MGNNLKIQTSFHKLVLQNLFLFQLQEKNKFFSEETVVSVIHIMEHFGKSVLDFFRNVSWILPLVIKVEEGLIDVLKGVVPVDVGVPSTHDLIDLQMLKK